MNVASDAASRPEQAIGAYSVSKAALVTMSRLLASILLETGSAATVSSQERHNPWNASFRTLGRPGVGR